jgi:hypothetical protein
LYSESLVEIETTNGILSVKATGMNKKESRSNALTKMFLQLLEENKIPQNFVEQGKSFFSYDSKK